MNRNDPSRFSDGGGSELGRAVFGALREERPPAHLKARTLAGLGLATAATTASTAAATTATKVAGAASWVMIAKWMGVGALGMGVALGALEGVTWLGRPRPSSAPVAAASAAPGELAAVVPAPGAAGPRGQLVAAPDSPPARSAALLAAPGLRGVDDGPARAGEPSVAAASKPPAPRPIELAPAGATAAAPATAAGGAAAPLASESPPPGAAPGALATPGSAAAGVGAPAESAAAGVGAPAESATAARARTTIDGELAALGDAKAALAAGDVAGALRRLAAYRVDFARGQLGTEATVLEIEALVRSGDRARALEQARRFLAVHPASPHAPRVRALVGLDR